MRRPVPADVLDLVGDGQARLADARLDPPAQDEVLAEDRCLQRLAFRPEHALVALPVLAVTRQPGGAVGEAPVERELLGLLRRVVILGGRVLGHEQRVVDPAGGEKAAAPVAHEAETLPLVEPGAGEADAGVPRQRTAGEFTATDVEGAVDEDVEGEAGARPELEHAHAALGPVSELGQPNAGDLPEATGVAQEVGARVGRSPELRHAGNLQDGALRAQPARLGDREEPDGLRHTLPGLRRPYLLS